MGLTTKSGGRRERWLLGAAVIAVIATALFHFVRHARAPQRVAGIEQQAGRDNEAMRRARPGGMSIANPEVKPGENPGANPLEPGPLTPESKGGAASEPPTASQGSSEPPSTSPPSANAANQASPAANDERSGTAPDERNVPSSPNVPIAPIAPIAPLSSSAAKERPRDTVLAAERLKRMESADTTETDQARGSTRALSSDTPRASQVAPRAGRSASGVSSRASIGQAKSLNPQDLIREGRVTEALDALRAQLQRTPADAKVRQTLIALLLPRSDTTEVRTLLKEGLNRDPRRMDYALALARIVLDEEGPADALDVLEKFPPELNSENFEGAGRAGDAAVYYGFRGALNARLGRPDAAAEALRRAVAIAPGNAAMWQALGGSLQAAGEHKGAIEAYQRVVSSTRATDEMRATANAQLRALGGSGELRTR